MMKTIEIRLRFASLMPLLLVGGIFLMSSLVGCGGGSGRQAADGTVTLDGDSLSHGVISFNPFKGNASPGSGGAVIEGRFEILAEEGLHPGKYHVEILALKETGRMIQDVAGGPERPERLIVNVNETEQFEAVVALGEESHFEFHLTTAN